MPAAIDGRGLMLTTNPFDGLDRIPELVELAHSGKMAGKGIIRVDAEQIRRQHREGLELV